ncbi:hypothetical protein BGS_0017 [Beggiatoa sp. SS]|nr:hypothetical protein BGS_0017 [Beggiatoa sp. SS]
MDEKSLTLDVLKGVNVLLLDNPMNNASFPFTRQQRLLNPKQYQLVFEQPCKSSDQYLTILARTIRVAQARLGWALPKNS